MTPFCMSGVLVTRHDHQPIRAENLLVLILLYKSELLWVSPVQSATVIISGVTGNVVKAPTGETQGQLGTEFFVSRMIPHREPTPRSWNQQKLSSVDSAPGGAVGQRHSRMTNEKSGRC